MIPELVACFDRSLVFLREQVEDLCEEEMVQQPSGMNNHAAWTLGHIIHSCQAIAGELGVEPWLPGDWETAFGYGSNPSKTISPHSKPELLSKLSEAGDRLRTALLAMDQRKLAEPLPDVNARELLPTVGHALLQVVAAHTAYHAGQLAAWRRAIGRSPRGVFI